jgi:hypothetical protein
MQWPRSRITDSDSLQLSLERAIAAVRAINPAELQLPATSYRAIYEIKDDAAKFVSVEEVNKHEY